jgi:hypothetical protein
MKAGMIILAAVVVTSLAPHVAGQGMSPAARQRLLAVKESVARNQAELRQYTWTEQIQISFDNEVRKTEESLCHYGPDGRVQRTPVGSPAASPAQGRASRSIMGRIEERARDEVVDFLEQAKTLIHSYFPPSAQLMEKSFGRGNASIGQTGPGTVELQFDNYLKPGDSLSFDFQPAERRMQKLSVNTYMDKPSEPLALEVIFDSLPDGTNCPMTEILSVPSRRLRVTVQNSNYQKLLAN